MNFEREFNEVKERAEEIFETGNILATHFEDYTESIAYLLEIDSYCILDVYIDNKEVYITIKEINTYLYNDISDVEDILERIKRLANEF